MKRKEDQMEKYPVIDVYETGQNLKRIMELRGLNVYDIQEYLGFATKRSIYHWFKGENLPTIDNLYALSALFHIPVDGMLCGNRKDRFCHCEQGKEFLCIHELNR